MSNAGEFPRENQKRAIAVLNHLANQGPGGELLMTALTEMERRWELLETWTSNSNCYATQTRAAATKTDAWSTDGSLRRPTPPYAWVECKDGAALGDDETCYDRVLSWNVKGIPGSPFGDETGTFMRLELLMRAPAFDRMYDRLLAMEAACPGR